MSRMSFFGLEMVSAKNAFVFGLTAARRAAALNALLPEPVGGKPEVGKAYYQQAIDASEGRNLYAKTLMAEFHARLVFDQELHDRLLNEVLAADPKAPRYTLMNTLAQARAKALLESGKDYF